MKAVENPTDVDDLIKVAHRISCSYGALAPDNWTPNDPRRPYPNKEEIRRGYLGHLDDSGKFLSTLWDVVAQIHPSGNFASVSALPTPGAANATPTQPILCSSGQTPNLSSILPESLDGVCMSCSFLSVCTFRLRYYTVHYEASLAPQLGAYNCVFQLFIVIN